MSGFWAQRLAPQQPVQAPVQATSRPWWMPSPQQQTEPAPFTPIPQQQSVAQSVPLDQESSFGDLLHQDGYTTEKAQSMRDTETCPECDSPNYMSPKGIPNAMKQCFNCGFNPRFSHSTAGASGIGQKNVAPPKPARVQMLNESNFNPKHIIGRVA